MSLNRDRAGRRVRLVFTDDPYTELSIEVNTGMRHSQGSKLAHVQRTYGVKARTKKNALVELRQIYSDTFGREHGS